MRFNTPIFFQTVKQGEYNAATGNYGEDIITEEKLYASVTSAGVETLNLIYGELKQGSLIVRLQNHYTKSFHRIRIGRKIYKADFSRPTKMKQVFIVSEVQ